ncbi:MULTISPECIES: class I SAM-dependent methyltransferase [Leptospira]|uniref:Methyltransferase domain-containing protein n=1 Tax=Leptospira interrogans serovar Bataviae TaxID=312175 RepID=A0AAP9WJU2_LEPIR|nr:MULTISPECIES: methyltransferase domain-containing protein [Leptospira]EMN73814.1 methyltransferase domain protein [Leptospira interrogans serovar Bataviae str. UI 08561]EKP04903.1 methyltransferase domain protein [Leptospira kirschneri str. 2008720114]EKR24612.1 methyltransferase domain protein [Leptospira interrogans serovar Bataviae str. L1111]MCR8647613.1 SAM-dependent methyltransferase [Leptospira interrogans serovar Bataviae]OAM73271.1 methyltransferase [Leptospira interrogans serovar 
MNIESKILDLGCGNKKRVGAIGIDFNDRTQADIIHNLNSFPYPFEDSYFDEIYIDNCLEHLDDVIKVMEEVYRICKPGGLVKVIVPYFRSLWAFTDPTHKHFFGVNSFTYFDPDHIICIRYDYTLARFKSEKIIFNETLQNSWIRKVIVFLANLHPARYESHLSHLYPLDDITFYLRKI